MYAISDYQGLAGIGDAIKEYAGMGLTAIQEKVLAEVEARAKKGAEEAVKTPLMIAYGLGGLALIVALMAFVRAGRPVYAPVARA